MEQHHRPMLALSLRLASALALTTMFTVSKLLGQHGVAVTEMMFWRQLVSLPLIAGGLATAGQLDLLRTARPGAHLFRAILGTLGMGLFLGTMQILHISEATTLNFTTPLFVVVITALFLPEKVGPWRWAAVGIGFAGVLLITSPGSAALPPLGVAMGLAAAAMSAVISFHIRDMARTEAPVTVVFWFAVFGALFVVPALPFVYHPHDAIVWAMLACMGVTGTIAQWFLTAALRHGPVASVVVMDYTQMLWATIYGWLVWGDLPHPTIWLGAPLIMGSGMIIAWRGHRQMREAMALAAAD
jgi:drug/metabolite transporter (DMT)-like permease